MLQETARLFAYHGLLNFLKENCVPSGEYILPSGKRANIHVDLYPLLQDHYAHRVLDEYAAAIMLDRWGGDFDVFAGVECCYSDFGFADVAHCVFSVLIGAGNSMSFLTSSASQRVSFVIEDLIHTEHGLDSRIYTWRRWFDGTDGSSCRDSGKHDGRVVKGKKVILFADVTDSGESLLAAILAIRKLNGAVERAYVVVDKGNGAINLLRENGVHLIPLFELEDLL